MPKRRKRKSRVKKEQQKMEAQIKEAQIKLEELRQKELEEIAKLKQELESKIKEIEALKAQLQNQPQPNPADQLQHALENTKKFIINLTHDPDVAYTIGQVIGVDVSTLVNQLQKAIEGKISLLEGISMAKNVLGAIEGYLLGDAAYKDLQKVVMKVIGKVAKAVEEEEDVGA